MFVHNHRTASVWVKRHVGRKETAGWGGEGKLQANTSMRGDTETETVAIFLMVHLVAILDTS